MSQRRAWRLTPQPYVVATAAIAALAALCSADEPPAAGAAGNLLVLKNGRIVFGRIQYSPGGYLVEKANGSMLVPSESVNFAAADKQDAYQKMRDRIPASTPAHHTAIARWCITCEMYDAAREELREALTLDPTHREARRTLMRLDEVLNAAAGKVSPPSHTSTNSSGIAEPAEAGSHSEPPEARSLAGLSREAARTFVADVQPILINKCGNATCHGSAAANPFRLVHVRLSQGSHRIYAEQNLAAVLRYVDLENPAHSPLLTLSSGSHGLAGRAVFDGHGGDEQLRILRGWLADAARDRLRGIDRSREAGFESDDFEPESLILIRGRTAPDVQPADPADADKDLLNAILHDERRDEFDPEEFNRRVHGHEQGR